MTRLVVDCEWEKRMWKLAWAPRVVTIDEECVGESITNNRKDGVRGSKKRLKLNQEEGVAWGQAGSAEDDERRRFLFSALTPAKTVPKNRKTIELLSCQEWLCRSLLKEVLESDVELVEMVELISGVDNWEE